MLGAGVRECVGVLGWDDAEDGGDGSVSASMSKLECRGGVCIWQPSPPSASVASSSDALPCDVPASSSAISPLSSSGSGVPGSAGGGYSGGA